MMALSSRRVVGLDIHLVFAEGVMLENGVVRRLGRVGMTRHHLAALAKTLTHDAGSYPQSKIPL